MKIEHIALYVADLERARDFFARYFGAKSGAIYHNPSKGFKSYFLSFDEGARLEIMTSDAVLNQNAAGCCGFNHIAFAVGRRQAVDKITERLRADGYRVKSGPRLTGDGYYESVVLDAESNSIEITE